MMTLRASDLALGSRGSGCGGKDKRLGIKIRGLRLRAHMSSILLGDTMVPNIE